MVAVVHPGESDFTRKRNFLDFCPVAERVALALNDESWAAKIFQVLGSKLLGLSRRMKWVAEAGESGDCFFREQLVGNEARDPAAHRLAADDQNLAWMLFADIGYDIAIFSDQRFRAWRWTLRSAIATARHVAELEKGQCQSPLDQKAGHRFEKRRSYPRPCAMG